MRIKIEYDYLFIDNYIDFFMIVHLIIIPFIIFLQIAAGGLTVKGGLTLESGA